MYEAYYEKHSDALSVDSDVSAPTIWSVESKSGLFSLKSSLTAIELAQIIALYDSQKEVSIQQHPHWDDLVRLNGETKYFLCYQDLKLIAYAIIRFPNSREAEILFGPVAQDRNAGLKAIRKIRTCLKEVTKVWQLKIQLPWQTGADSAYVEAHLINEFGVRSIEDKRNWSSSRIDTNRTNEDLATNFSKNHKRSLKKAIKQNLTTRVLKTDAEIEVFNDIYVRMYATRGQTIDAQSNLEEYKRLQEFFSNTGQGFFFGVFKDDELIGGMILIKQADHGFYHHSASDPEFRKLPIQHIGILNLLDELRDRGIRYFDFGGYNHMVDKSDQVYNINRFKDGFTRDYMFYPKILYFEFVPNSVYLLEKFQSAKNLVKKIVGR